MEALLITIGLVTVICFLGKIPGALETEAYERAMRETEKDRIEHEERMRKKRAM